MNRLIEFFAKQGLFAVLILIYTLVMGVYVVFLIQKEAFPNIQRDVLRIETIFPGASPTETEKLVTNPIEQALKTVMGIKRLKSTSIEGRSYVSVELDPDQTTVFEAKQDVKEAIDRIERFPERAEDPIVVSLETKYRPVIKLVISTSDETVTPIELRNTARFVQDEIEKLSGVASIDAYGIGDLEIHVEAIPKKLSLYQLTLADITRAIASQNQNIPGGVIEQNTSDGKREVLVRTVNDYEDVKDIENTVVRSNDLVNAILIKDVANVSYGLERPVTLFRGNSKDSIYLTIKKKETSDSIRLVDAIKKRVEDLKPRLSQDIEFTFVDDLSYFIRRRLNVLINNLSIGLALVLIILSFFFPLKVALLTAIGIPFAFLGTLIFFHVTGVSLNLLTMMGLIIVLGMLVDDAIVVIENTMRYIEKGYSSTEAAIKATCQIWQPVTAAVCTTIVVFLPLMFMSGIIGKFIAILPLGVLSGLVLSLFECFFILPHHTSFLTRKYSSKPANANSLTQTKKSKKKLYQKVDYVWKNICVVLYERFLHFTLKLRYIAIIFSIVLLAATYFLYKEKMNFVLFPSSGVEAFMIKIQAPIGTPLENTVSLMRPIEKIVATLSDEELKDYITKGGIHQASASDPDFRRGSHLGLVFVYLTSTTERDRTADQIIKDLRDQIGQPPGIDTISFEKIRSGPSSGPAVSVGVRGNEYDGIMPAVQDLQEFLSQIEGVSDIRNTHDVGKEELHVKILQEEALAAGLSTEDIGLSVRAAFEGIEATYIQKLDEEIAIRVTWPDQFKSSKKSVQRLKIPNNFGNLIPITSVVDFGTHQGISTFKHEANERQVEVRADVNTNIITSLEINNQIREALPKLREKHPSINFSFGGEDQDTKESMGSLRRAFVVALLGIFMILVLTFQRLSQALLVLFITVPLGITSVIWTFFVHDKPISFMACLGIVALSGVIVNNSIVFTSFVNEARSKGVEKIQSILDAGKTRLRPIFLTTVTTVAGILPTAYGLGGLDPFVVPIALALGWGMFFGSFLTTILFPSWLAILDDITLFLFKMQSLFNKLLSPQAGFRQAGLEQAGFEQARLEQTGFESSQNKEILKNKPAI